jgi:hypothetical protein
VLIAVICRQCDVALCAQFIVNMPVQQFDRGTGRFHGGIRLAGRAIQGRFQQADTNGVLI